MFKIRELAEGDRVWIPPGESSEGLPVRTGTVEELAGSRGGALVRHDDGRLYGWGYGEISDVSGASWRERIAGRAMRWRWLWLRGGRAELSLLPRILSVRERVLNLVGTCEQEQIYTGYGDFEYGERVWEVDRRSFSYDNPPMTVREALVQVEDALREAQKVETGDVEVIGGITLRTDDEAHYVFAFEVRDDGVPLPIPRQDDEE